MIGKIFIKNRHNKKLCVLVEDCKNNKGLVFLLHGLGGYKEQKHIRTFAKIFKKNKFVVVTFDARNTIGESEGKYENANLTNQYADLVDVINWSEKQKWYSAPFYIAGHSLGSMCTLLYAEKYPKKVKAIAPVSAVLSGKLLINNLSKERIREYTKTGYWVRISNSKPGNILKLDWKQFYKDLLKYDLLKNVNKITMPVLLIVGENDTNTPLADQKLLYDKLKSNKELHVIKGAKHTFKEEKHLNEITKIMDCWIKKTNK
ncbi:MAG: alpha/beta hydrolase [Candidatus Woesearchaeota archaeon]